MELTPVSSLKSPILPLMEGNQTEAVLCAVREGNTIDMQRITCAQQSTAEQLEKAISSLKHFNAESEGLLEQCNSSVMSTHATTLLELKKVLNSLEERIFRCRARAERLAEATGTEVNLSRESSSFS